MSREPIEVRSSAEASLCLLVLPCARCAGGPLDPTGQASVSGRGVTLDLTCRSCSTSQTVTLTSRPGVGIVPLCTDLAELCSEPDVPCISPSPQRSRAIDVWGWITLHSLVQQVARRHAESAAVPADRASARRLQVLASACLDEALRFYDHDNELPPPGAFFTDVARRQFQLRPELFMHKRLRELRSSGPRIALQ
jgi:hypothetical protein